MTTQDSFEAWIKSDWPEVDLTRLPSGNYRIKSTQDKWEGYRAAWSCQQASIDRLMLEFCPDEMGDEQMRKWLGAQRPLDPDFAAVLDKSLRSLYLRG